jgi:hypothetical protein
MRRALLSGCFIAVAAALTVLLGAVLGEDLEHFALLGAALGGVIGLVPHTPAWGKLAGFGVGFVLAWIGFALRAAVLPDAPSGRAVAAFLVIILCVAVCGLSAGRIPLWSTLVGAAAIVGAYEATYTNSPVQFLSDSPTAATTVLIAAGLGYLATTLVAVAGPTAAGDHRAQRATSGEMVNSDVSDTDDHDVDLDDVRAGDTK